MDDYNLEEIITIIFCHSTKFGFRNKHLVEQIEPDLAREKATTNTAPKPLTATGINALPSPVSIPQTHSSMTSSSMHSNQCITCHQVN